FSVKLWHRIRVSICLHIHGLASTEKNCDSGFVLRETSVSAQMLLAIGAATATQLRDARTGIRIRNSERQYGGFICRSATPVLHSGCKLFRESIGASLNHRSANALGAALYPTRSRNIHTRSRG